jgi:hypothetical protein
MTWNHGKVKPQGQKIEGLNKLLGGKWEEVKRCFSFTFHWPPSLEHSIGHQALEHSIGHQALEHSIGHQGLDLHSPPFSFSLKGEFGSLGALSFPAHNFQFNFEYLFRQAS